MASLPNPRIGRLPKVPLSSLVAIDGMVETKMQVKGGMRLGVSSPLGHSSESKQAEDWLSFFDLLAPSEMYGLRSNDLPSEGARTMRPSLSASTKAARAWARNNPSFLRCRRSRRHWLDEDNATAVDLPKDQGAGWRVTMECVRCHTLRHEKWDRFGNRFGNLTYEWPDGYKEEFASVPQDKDAQAALNMVWLKIIRGGRSQASVHQLPVKKSA